MGIGHIGKYHLHGFFLFFGFQFKLVLEKLNDSLPQAILHRWQVRHIIHPYVCVVVPVVVIAFIPIGAYKASPMQEIVLRIVLYHSTYMIESIVIPFVFHRLASRISRAEHSQGFRSWQYNIANLIQAFHIATNDCRFEYAEELALTIYKIQRVLLIIHHELVVVYPPVSDAVARNVWRS